MTHNSAAAMELANRFDLMTTRTRRENRNDEDLMKI